MALAWIRKIHGQQWRIVGYGSLPYAAGCASALPSYICSRPLFGIQDVYSVPQVYAKVTWWKVLR